MFSDLKAIKVCKLMHICVNIYNIWCLVYNDKKNIKFYDFIKYFFDKYEYKYI